MAADQLRIFFALWPDASTRARISAIARRIPVARPARRVPDYNLHLTLHFIGNVDYDLAECLRREARAARGQVFEIDLDRVGRFDGARVGWLGCKHTPRALIDLQSDLGARLERCGYRPEARRFRPHVTLVRKLIDAPPAVVFETLSWRVDSFALVESRGGENGVKYRVVETYPLS